MLVVVRRRGRRRRKRRRRSRRSLICIVFVISYVILESIYCRILVCFCIKFVFVSLICIVFVEFKSKMSNLVLYYIAELVLRILVDLQLV